MKMNASRRCSTLFTMPVVLCLLAGCSSGGDGSPEPGDDLQDDTTTILNASNVASVLTASMDLLRADVYNRSSSLLDQLATQWEPIADATPGTVQHDCPAGGTLVRVVTEASDYLSAPPVYKLASELQFSDCTVGEVTLNGTAGWNWSRSSVSSLGDESYYDNYDFSNFSLQQADVSESLTGTFYRSVSVPGPGDAYERTSTTTLYTTNRGGSVSTLADATYTQIFGHYIANPDSPNGVYNNFTESGQGTLSIGSLALQDARLTIDPTLVYANELTGDNTLRSDALASGGLELSLPDGTTLTAGMVSAESGTLAYVLTDVLGQQTTIEREWIAPTPCVPDDRFRYDSCF